MFFFLSENLVDLLCLKICLILFLSDNFVDFFFGRVLFDMFWVAICLIVFVRNLVHMIIYSTRYVSFEVAKKLAGTCYTLIAFCFLYFYNTTKTQVFYRYAHAALIRSKVSICLPWIVTFLVYSLMHWSYPRDIRHLEKERPQSENDTTSV